GAANALLATPKRHLRTGSHIAPTQASRPNTPASDAARARPGWLLPCEAVALLSGGGINAASPPVFGQKTSSGTGTARLQGPDGGGTPPIKKRPGSSVGSATGHATNPNNGFHTVLFILTIQ